MITMMCLVILTFGLFGLVITAVVTMIGGSPLLAGRRFAIGFVSLVLTVGFIHVFLCAIFGIKADYGQACREYAVVARRLTGEIWHEVTSAVPGILSGGSGEQETAAQTWPAAPAWLVVRPARSGHSLLLADMARSGAPRARGSTTAGIVPLADVNLPPQAFTRKDIGTRQDLNAAPPFAVRANVNMRVEIDPQPFAASTASPMILAATSPDVVLKDTVTIDGKVCQKAHHPYTTPRPRDGWPVADWMRNPNNADWIGNVWVESERQQYFCFQHRTDSSVAPVAIPDHELYARIDLVNPEGAGTMFHEMGEREERKGDAISAAGWHSLGYLMDLVEEWARVGGGG